jgi:hypothetical protein
MAEKVWWLSVMTHEKYLSYGGLSGGERWMWGRRVDMQVDEEMNLLSTCLCTFGPAVARTHGHSGTVIGKWRGASRADEAWVATAVVVTPLVQVQHNTRCPDCREGVGEEAHNFSLLLHLSILNSVAPQGHN